MLRNTRSLTSAVLFLSALIFTTTADAQPRRGGGPPGPGIVEPQKGERIAWFGTLTSGLAEAKATGKPILLVSAAPHCHNVPGVW